MSDLQARMAAAGAATSGSGVASVVAGQVDWDGGSEDSDSSLKFHTSLDRHFREASNLLIRKHKDYGPSNIADAPGGPLNGLRVRMFDKTARINHLIDNDRDPENESLRDSFLDLANYAIIALMVLDGDWPKGTR